MTRPGRWCAAFKFCLTSFSFFSSIDYFRQTTPKAWTPDGIYCSYRTLCPTKPRRQLLRAIKKDLELLGKGDNALVAKQAHLFLKKWSTLKFPLQEDPADSSSSAAAATATAQESTRTSIGRKIDVLMEHDQFELSGSEWKTPQCTQAMKDRHHNKNIRVNACILSQLLQLPFNTQQDPNVHIVTMEWTGFTGELLFVKKVDNYYVVGSLGNVYLPTTLDDLEDFRDSLKLLFYFKHHHQHLQRTIQAPLARRRRLRVSGAKFQSNGDIFATPTRGK